MVGESRVIQIKDVSIGDNIRRIRKEKGYKQTEIVSQLQLRGCDISTYGYNKIEKGTQNPTVSLLLYLCQILDCDMNAVFCKYFLHKIAKYFCRLLQNGFVGCCTYISTLQQPTFLVCNFLYFYYTLNI